MSMFFYVCDLAGTSITSRTYLLLIHLCRSFSHDQLQFGTHNLPPEPVFVGQIEGLRRTRTGQTKHLVFNRVSYDVYGNGGLCR